MDPETTIFYTAEDQHGILRRAAAEGAYTFVGRIPFLNGNIPSHSPRASDHYVDEAALHPGSCA